VRTGDLYGAKFCYDDLPNRLDPFDQETFQKDPMEFYIGATDMNTGHAVFHLCKDMGRKDLQWMRASASMPLVSRIVRVDGFELLDGGIVTSVPYGFMERRGYNRNVIVLTQPAGYCKEPVKMALFKVMLRKYPRIVDAMAVRHEMYNRQMEEIGQREASGESLVIRPPESLGIKRTENDPDQLERVYQIGRREAERRLPDVRMFLGGCAKA
jgi:predicted patatin/cPLA2 family phospholipase